MNAKNGRRLLCMLAAIAVLIVLPGMAFAGGTIEKITEVGTVSGDSITVKKAELTWYAKDVSVGRYQDGWWVGVKIIAPNTVTGSNVGNVYYSNDGTDNLVKSFETYNDGKVSDGRYYMGCWLPVTTSYLENALNSNSVLQWTYKFDWDGDKKAEQTFIITVDPSDITLNKDGKVYSQSVNGKMVMKDGNPLPADYTEVDKALAAIPKDLSLYTDESVKAVAAARDAVVRGKNAIDQSVVDGYAVAINKAVQGLKLRSVDLPKTGDESSMMLWIALLTLACTGMAGMYLGGRRAKKING